MKKSDENQEKKRCLKREIDWCTMWREYAVNTCGGILLKNVATFCMVADDEAVITVTSYVLIVNQ